MQPAPRRVAALAVFGVLALAGAALVVKGEFDVAAGGWTAAIADVGDFSARRVLAAGSSKATWRAPITTMSSNTYPLPHELPPLALVHGYAAAFALDPGCPSELAALTYVLVLAAYPLAIALLRRPRAAPAESSQR